MAPQWSRAFTTRTTYPNTPPTSDTHTRLNGAAPLRRGRRKRAGTPNTLAPPQWSRAFTTPDEWWWRLGEAGDVEAVELLGLSGRIDRDILEQTTVAVRKNRRALPEGTRLLRYGRQSPIPTARTTHREPATANAIRFQLTGPAPVRMRHFVLATDTMHRLARKLLDNLDPERISQIIGRQADGPRRADHDHLHIAVVPDRSDAGRPISGGASVASLVLWTKDLLPDEAVSALTSHPQILTTKREDLDQHLPDQRLLLAGIGPLGSIAPATWTASSTEWVSATPYLPVRHRHRNRTPDEHLAEDLIAECDYRGLPAPVAAESVHDRTLTAQVAQFRRRRMHAPASKDRRGIYTRLTFAQAVTGPLFLGALSHFGYGQFLPLDKD